MRGIIKWDSPFSVFYFSLFLFLFFFISCYVIHMYTHIRFKWERKKCTGEASPNAYITNRICMLNFHPWREQFLNRRVARSKRFYLKGNAMFQLNAINGENVKKKKNGKREKWDWHLFLHPITRWKWMRQKNYARFPSRHLEDKLWLWGISFRLSVWHEKVN